MIQNKFADTGHQYGKTKKNGNILKKSSVKKVRSGVCF